MFSNFEKNEIFLSCEYIKSHNLQPDKGVVFNVVGNHILCDYLCNTIKNLNGKTEYNYSVYQADSPDAFISTVSKQCFLYLLDARDEKKADLALLKKALDYAVQFEQSQFVVMTITPTICARDDVQSLSEMETSTLLSDTVLFDIDNLLKDYCDALCIKEIRFDNFLVEDSEFNALNFTSIVKETLSNNCVVINSTDAFDYVSAVSMADAVNAVFTVMKHGKPSNIYNCSGELMSLYDAKSFVYETLCGYGIKLQYNDNTQPKGKTYRALSCGKLQSLSYSYTCDNNTRLLYALSDLVSEKYDIIADKTNSLYDGKLKYIRDMELELLSQVDRICRANNIQYFLSGGTMLGAVRHKGFIPWDDDIDIAMLREDFEKFKQVAKEQLPKKYQYQSYTNKDGYHYFFDKITIKDTYFSTKYSDGFDMLKGISMDIFVFDKTSDKKFFQKLHYKKLMMLRLLMNVRWINKPRKDKSYMLSKLLLPVLRLFSMDFYSKRYDKLLRKYEKKKTTTVLPPATDHKWRGVMPKSWFENVTDAQFENVMSYIPTGYDNYLKQWYSDDYMELLPLSQRVGSHDFYRLDIGNELKCETENYTHYNYKGELL